MKEKDNVFKFGFSSVRDANNSELYEALDCFIEHGSRFAAERKFIIKKYYDYDTLR